MKRTLLFSILTITFINVFPQVDEEKHKTLLTNGIYILPTQLFFPEIQLSYEQFINPKFSLSYTLGYKIPVGKGNQFEPFGSGLFAVYEFQYMFNRFSNAAYFSLAPSFYWDSKRKYFIQFELFNRFYWFDKKQLSFDNVESTGYNSIRSEKNNVLGLKLLFGNNKIINISQSWFLPVKIYIGLGLRYKNFHYQNINNKWIGSDNVETVIPYEEENGTQITPSFHVGFKIGIAKRVLKRTQSKKI